MIVLDTNVVSDSSRPRPDLSVQGWLRAQRQADLFICTPVLAELSYGIERLSMGPRRSFLEGWLLRLEAEGFPNRVLPFERRAAYEFGKVLHTRTSRGRPIKTMDAIIAAIAKAEGATLATRDVADFADLGFDVVNPFEFVR
jgi:predicted nucleic acid-binding protein